MDTEQLKRILEALIMASSTPLNLERMLAVFPEDQQPEPASLREALAALAEDYTTSSLELKEVSSGFRFQVRKDFAEWVSKLWEEKPVPCWRPSPSWPTSNPSPAVKSRRFEVSASTHKL